MILSELIILIFFTSYCFSLTPAYLSIDKSPFGVDIHHWNTRNDGYDDGINDGLTNSKIFQYIREAGALWVSDYGQSEGREYYWPETLGYSYMDSYALTVTSFGVNPVHVTLGWGSSPWSTRGLPPDDWVKYFNLIKEVAQRYKGIIKFYKVWHEIDSTDQRRYVGTCRDYVRMLKYAHDAIKSVDPNIVVEMSDLAYPEGSSNNWNNGEFYHLDGNANYVDEDALDKILYEITTNGNSSIYDTTSLGGFPASRNPLDYMDAVGFNSYPQDINNFGHYQAMIEYLYSILVKYGLHRDIPLQVHETGFLIWGYSGMTEQEKAEKRDYQAVFCVNMYRYLLRSGKITKVFFFHYDPITYGDEITIAAMVDFDVDNDRKNDTHITKYPAWYAYKKMTHLVYPRLEKFLDDEFLETGGTKFYNTGWNITNFETFDISSGVFTGRTKLNSGMSFSDLVLPSYNWERCYDKYGLNRYFIVRMKADKDTSAMLFWDNISTSAVQCDFSNINNSCWFDIKGDNQYRIYKVDLSENPYWNGIISAIKFCPSISSGTNVNIDYLGFSDPREPSSISISAQPQSLIADGNSASIITVVIVDPDTLPVTSSTQTITFNLTGNGALLGQNPQVCVSGKASITYISGTSTGIVTVTATSPGVTGSSILLTLNTTNYNPLQPSNLLCNGRENPSDIEDLYPSLSWKFNDVGDIQSAYRVLVADSLGLLYSDTGNIWDTGKILSVSSSVFYHGNILLKNKKYYWKVKTWDSFNFESPWSETAEFKTGTNLPYFSPVLSVSPKELNFGEVKIGSMKEMILGITNIGTGTLSGTVTPDKIWIEVSSNNFISNSIAIKVKVNNSILNEREGVHSGKIEIKSNGGDVVVNLNLTATCVIVYPNPYNPDKGKLNFSGTGVIPGKTIINIYTVSGIRIWENFCNPEDNEVTWDGKDKAGNKVLPGIYIYTYKSPVEKGTGKFTVIYK